MVNDNRPPAEVNVEIFDTAIQEAITMMMDRGMTTWEMVPILEKHVAVCRRPYQNPEDNA